MALNKEIRLSNGILTTYHRLVSINKITNITCLLEVASYISKEARKLEEEYQNVQMKSSKGEDLTEKEKELLEKGIDVFIESEVISVDYSEENNIQHYYEYLKTIDKFKNAEDDI